MTLWPEPPGRPAACGSDFAGGCVFSLGVCASCFGTAVDTVSISPVAELASLSSCMSPLLGVVNLSLLPKGVGFVWACNGFVLKRCAIFVLSLLFSPRYQFRSNVNACVYLKGMGVSPKGLVQSEWFLLMLKRTRGLVFFFSCSLVEQLHVAKRDDEK